MNPEEEVVAILKAVGGGITCTLPCDRVKNLHYLLSREFFHVPLAREEEGVGISAGYALTGGRPVMLLQSSGLGNMINALASLTKFYSLPLLLLVSWRGVYKEGIDAQKPMGEYAPILLSALGIEFEVIEKREDISRLAGVADKAYRENRIAAGLFSPRVWEGSKVETSDWREGGDRLFSDVLFKSSRKSPAFTRYEIIDGVKDVLRDKLVVGNLGVPSKELYSIFHQPSNFYMLGSMGMASSIGLGAALGTGEEVVVIDGDGSLLMNLGTLSTVAEMNPENLTILAIDNAAHGSTGNQPTATLENANLGMIAKGMGLKNVHTVNDPEKIKEAMEKGIGPRFVHAVAKPGNADVKNIPLTPQEIKSGVMGFLKKGN
jgi:sulfopyruvate decarboxylase subunit beta